MSETTVPLLPIPRDRSGGATRAATLLTAALAVAALACQGDIEARMAEVRALQDVGQFSASIEELREILAIVPDLPEASYRLGVALVQTGEPSRAVWALEKAAESDEYEIPASLLLASAHYSAQNFEATVTAANRVLERDPDRLPALRMRAMGYVGSGNLEAALEDAQRLREAKPDDYSTMALYATILADMHRLDEAEAAHVEMKRIALESGDPPTEHRGCVALAMFFRDYRKDNERAEELYDECLERYPTSSFVVSESVRFFESQGKTERATEVIRRAVEGAPENLSLRSQLASRLANSGDSEAAEQVLLEAVDSFKSAGAWSLLANFQRREGQPEKALEAMEKVAELSGGGDDATRFTQADLLIDLGRLEEAEGIAEDLEQPTYAVLLRGRIALERDDPGTALRLFDEGIRAWPDNAGARYLAGMAALDLGDADRAISELREAVRADPQATAAAEVLARLYYERGDYADSIRFGRSALKRGASDRVEVLALATRSLVELERYDEARGMAQRLIELDGGKMRGTSELARVERAAEGPAAARRTIEESGLDLSDPENEPLLHQWVDLRAAEGGVEEALARADAAVAAEPDRPGYHEMRGSLLVQLGHDEDARAAFEKATQLDPERGTAWAGLATVAARGNDLARAVELFDKAAELSPETSVFLYSAAQLSYAAGDSEGAERRYREIVRHFPGHAGARNDLAWILAERGVELDLALELAEEAQRLDPSPDVLDTLGWVHFKRGELSAAVATLEQAVEARSTSPSIRYRLGIALRKAGDSDRAKEMLQAAIASGAFPEAADARRELAQLEQP
jgi:tetratricopeptide (TPR) repeat protein